MLIKPSWTASRSKRIKSTPKPPPRKRAKLVILDRLLYSTYSNAHHWPEEATVPRRKELRTLHLPFNRRPEHTDSGETGDTPRPPVKMTKHHLVPQSRGGETSDSNLVLLNERGHQAWHFLFGNMTPEEAAIFLFANFAPPGYFDFVLIRQKSTEIRLSANDLTFLRESAPERGTVPNFQDAKHRNWVRPIYARRHRKGKKR
jgi:hypothetical protein